MKHALSVLFFFYCCTITTIHTDDIIEIDPLTIERSPSTTSILDFCHHIEDSVAKAQEQNPHQAFYLDFNTVLLPLFARLQKKESVPAQLMLSIWKKYLHKLSASLAQENQHIYGINLVYINMDDLQIASNIVEPLVTHNKLKTCGLASVSDLRSAVPPYNSGPRHITIASSNAL